MMDYKYPIEQYDDIDGLDTLSMDLPAMDRDAVEQCTWNVMWGIPTDYDPKNFGMDGDDPFIYLEPQSMKDSPIPSNAVNHVHHDVLETLIKEEEVRISEDQQGADPSVIATIDTKWKHLKGEWRLHRYDFTLDV